MTDSPKLAEIIEAVRRAAEACVRDAYDAGRRDMVCELLAKADVAHPPSSVSGSAPRLAAGRVERGTIRPIVLKILRAEAGLTRAEITQRVIASNPEIAAPSVANELARNERGERKGLRIYRRTRGRWYINDPRDEHGLPEMEEPAVAEDDRPAGITLNGSHVDERPTIGPSGPGE